ncbi:hypothetical protein Q6346_12820 [Isoptericola sp. b490]|uniref:hypothetical protein n=1 Tax=Actinotalea lenta TaxID=3064654 RepID=UPI00271345DC|nr:hypothetical protein [Isoptericola sp. b490]MDO8122192.1 hypothetical protein [Isoptericola sp. b490]
MLRRHRRLAAAVALAGLTIAVAACTANEPPVTERSSTTRSTTPPPQQPDLQLPSAPTTVLDDATGVAASRALFADAPVVVLAPADDTAAQLGAASAAVALGAPMLLVQPEPSSTGTVGPSAATPADGTSWAGASSAGTSSAATPSASRQAAEAPWRAEVRRLGAKAVLAVGDLRPSLAGLTVVHAPDPTALDPSLGLGSGTALRVPVGDAVAAVAGLDRAHPALLVPAGPTGGPSASPSAPTSGAPTPSTPTSGTPTPSAAAGPALPRTTPAPAPGDGVLLTDGDASTLAAVATARAAGLPVATVPGGDPRASSATVRAVASVTDRSSHVLAVGPAFSALGGATQVDWRVRTAATGTELPGGGQLVFSHRRLVALYGTPGDPRLGVLGEQDLAATLERADDLAGTYQGLTKDKVEPSLEIIATIASRGAGPDGNYSDERPAADLLPWVKAAQEHGEFVILDLQPGRTDFLTQAKEYEELLSYPNVGLALDPEWRLKPDQVHLRQIGSVGIDEVNAVVTWLADLTRREQLPQKALVLHQFSLSMIHDREKLDTSRPELAIVVHADGQGGQPAKAGTWRALQRNAPSGLHWGWKNFLDEDHPVLTPEQTYQITPAPVLVTYQ